jgi:hypothetical protein
MEVAATEQILRLWNSRSEVRVQLGDETFAREMAAGKQLILNGVWAIPNPQGPALATPVLAAASSDASALPTARELEVLRLLA